MLTLTHIVTRVSLRLILILLSTCALVCFAPGFDSDERQLDLRLDSATVAKMKQVQSQDRNPIAASVRYVSGLVRGEFGFSSTFNRPISELLSERLMVTLPTVAGGLLLGWLLAVTTASLATILDSRLLSAAGGFFAASLLCAPSVLLAFGFVALQAPAAAAMACVVFPRVYLNLNTFFRDAAVQPHAIAAEAIGMSRVALFRFHIVSVNVPQIATLAMSSVSTALGAIVPIEVISDLGGIGQLAWRAALGRDLRLLLSVTMAIALINTIAAVCTDSLVHRLREART